MMMMGSGSILHLGTGRPRAGPGAIPEADSPPERGG